MKERVQKLMAQANIGSRRACEELIRQGRVRVNGQTIHLGDQADPLDDRIEVDGTVLKFQNIKRYFAINKPINVLSSNNTANYDDERTPVRELIPYEGHLFSIGRLDAESDGLMVLTNDGEMANMLTHPRYQHTKTYKVVVYGTPTQGTLDTWEKGVYLEEGLTAPCSIRVQQREADVTVLKIVMIEGKKRQIRRVATQLGHPVKRLTRTHIGKLELGKLKHGEWYELNEEEVKAMTTPASDLSYIRKLRREQREQRKQDFVRRSKMSPEELAADNSRRLFEGKSATTSGNRYTPRLKEQLGRDDRPRKPGFKSQRSSERDGEQSTEHPLRRSSTSRPTGGRKPDRFNRDADGDNTERPVRRLSRYDETEVEQSPERPKRKPPISRPPKPRTGKPGTRNSRNKPPRKDRRIK